MEAGCVLNEHKDSNPQTAKVIRFVDYLSSLRGVGQVTAEFYSYAASCGATNTSNINSPSSLFESYISAFLNCTVTTTPGYYALHVEGCALGPPLCDAQDYVTTVYQ